jgi:hypothetical protein
MPSERVQRVIDGYLDEIEVAAKDGRWNDVSELANTILELDDTNDDAQTFLKLAVSKSNVQKINSADEKVDSVAESPTHDTTSITELSNEQYVEFLKTKIQETNALLSANLLDENSPQWRPLDADMPQWVALEECITSRKFRNFGKEYSKVSRMTSIATSNLARLNKNTTPEVETFKKKIEPVAEPTSDYWQTRQELTPVENQDSGTSSSSTSTKSTSSEQNDASLEPEPKTKGETALRFTGALVGAVVGGVLFASLGVESDSGAYVLARFTMIPIGAVAGGWLFGQFKS